MQAALLDIKSFHMHIVRVEENFSAITKDKTQALPV